MTIDVLPDDVLLEMFYFYRGQGKELEVEAWIPLVHTSKMAEHRFRVTTSAKSATQLHGVEVSEGQVGHLASLAYRHIERCLTNVWCG